MRVTNQVYVNNLLRDLNLGGEALLAVQRALASGRRIDRPSDDPVGAASAVGYERYRQRLEIYRRNLRSARSFLSAAEASFDSMQKALQDARAIAVAQASGTATADSRRAMAGAVDALIDDLVTAANAHFRGRYVFAGTRTDRVPFVREGAGVLYRGDDGAIVVDVSPAEPVTTSVPGSDLLGCLATRLGGQDLDPVIYLGEAGGEATLLSAVNAGSGFQAGRIEIACSAGVFQVDLAGCTDLADVKSRIEAATGGVVQVGYRPDRRGIRLLEATAAPLTVRDLAGGAAARSLGIAGGGPAGVIDGKDLDPVLTGFTRLADLNAGGGVDPAGFTVTHAGEAVSVTAAALSGMVAELLAFYNREASRSFLRLSRDGRGLELVGRVSGAALTVAEAGGGTAGQLGLSPGTYRADDTLSTLLDLRAALAADDAAGIAAAIDRLDEALSRLLAVRGSVGARLSRLEASEGRLEQQSFTVDELRSELVDANLAELAVRFAERRQALEAALKAAARVLPLSLVDFL